MAAGKNKEIVQRFFELFSITDVEGALSLVDDAATWRAMGLEGELPVSGEMDKSGIGTLIRTVKEMMPDGLRLTPTGWTAEGDRVALEMESYGTKTNGTVYNNLYHFLLTLRDGKIIAVREYLDTIHVKKVFIDDVNQVTGV